MLNDATRIVQFICNCANALVAKLKGTKVISKKTLVPGHKFPQNIPAVLKILKAFIQEGWGGVQFPLSPATFARSLQAKVFRQR